MTADDGGHGARHHVEEEAVLLRIYLDESARAGGEPAYKALIHLLRDRGVAGATAIKGVYGFGATHALHAATPLRLSGDLPIIVEAVDREDRIGPLLDDICDLFPQAVVTKERVTLLHRPEA